MSNRLAAEDFASSVRSISGSRLAAESRELSSDMIRPFRHQNGM
jgi:hypothetical protein